MEFNIIQMAALSMRATSEMINIKVGERLQPTLANSAKDYTTAMEFMQTILFTIKVFSSGLNQADRAYVSKESKWCASILSRTSTNS